MRVAAAALVLVTLAPAVADAQVRFRRPYAEGYPLGYGYDNDGAGPGCTDYACGGACYDGHGGEDFALPRGTRVLAGQQGRVVATHNGCANTGYVGNPCGGRCGNYVQLEHEDGSRTIYCHMQLGSIVVGVGDRVGCGQMLGRSASSGSSSGPHLHFGYRPSASSGSQEVFAGGCGRSSSLWVRQRGYLEAPGTACGRCSPSAERCNGADDDCDGAVDEGLRRACGTDVGVCERGVQSCSGGRWGSCDGGVSPSSERCNSADDDCDGAVDERVQRECGSDVGVCEKGVQRCAGGSWSACEGEVPPTPEQCNELDDDCDGESDEEQICEVEAALLRVPRGDSDVDGDGRADACARDGHGLVCHAGGAHGRGPVWRAPAVLEDDLATRRAYYTTLRTGDVDGDGRADVCARSTQGMHCWRSTAFSFGRRIDGPPWSDAAGWDDPAYFSTIRLADVDGDGRADVCGRAPEGLRCFAFDGRGFGRGVQLGALSDEQGWDRPMRYGSLRMGDLDGDGRADVCGRASEGVVCWLGAPHGFGRRVQGPPWSDAAGWDAIAHWSTIRLADIDGDRRDELCGRAPDGFRCHEFEEGAFGGPRFGPELSDADGWGRREQHATLRMGDVDGDGRADLCGRSAAGVSCWLAGERGLERRVEGPRLGDALGWDRPAHYRTIRLADVDADGRDELCARGPEGLACHVIGGGSDRLIDGPPWSDELGWDAEPRWATVRIAGGHPAGGTSRPGARDAGVSPDPSMSGGCSCRVGSARPAATALWALVAVLLLLSGRRPSRSSRENEP